MKESPRVCHACLLLAINFCLPRSDMSNALCKGCGNISDAASRENYNFSFTGFRVFFLPPLSFKCVISLRCNSGYNLHSIGKDELGPAGVVKGSPLWAPTVQPGPLHLQSPLRWAPIRWRSSGRTSLECLGTGKICGAGQGPKAGL